MMAALFASQSSNQVHLFEKNEKLGKKLYITGKGRCNLTNACEEEYFLSQVVSNPYFLYSSIYFLGPASTMALFEDLGLRLKIERGQRVFPKSDHASDVTASLERALRKNQVKIHLSEGVLSIKKDQKFRLKTSKRAQDFDRVIITTGGITYPQTGSTGDGYSFARALGHKIKEPKGALVGLRCGLDQLDKLSGLSLRNVELFSRGDLKKSFFGEMLFTHFGISGPIALSMSSYINRLKDVDLYLDLKPALDYETLDRRILRILDQWPNKEAKTLVEDLLPKSLVPLVLRQAKIPLDKPGHQWRREDRKNLAQTLKNFPLDYQGLFKEEGGIVTSGGVLTQEVDPSSLESKMVEGLYFAGEVLDLDALTGGFNIQIAFSTGALAGQSCLE